MVENTFHIGRQSFHAKDSDQTNKAHCKPHHQSTWNKNNREQIFGFNIVNFGDSAKSTCEMTCR